MSDLEYAKQRMRITENAIHELAIMIGYALPHMRPQLDILLDALNAAISTVDASGPKAKE